MDDVRPGDSIVQTAEDHNKVARIVRHFDQYPLPGGDCRGRPRDSRAYGYNSGSADLTGPRVVAISGNTFEPVLSTGELDPDCEWALHYQYTIAAADASSQRVAILPDPVTAGEFGEIILSGLARMLVAIKDTSHRYACIPSGGDGTKLESAVSGPFRIVSQPLETSGTAKTGDQWCTVFFPVLDSEDTIVTGSITAVAGDVVRTISADAVTGIVTVGTPNADSQSNIMILTSALSSGGYGTATRRNDVLANYDTSSVPAAGDTLGTVSGSLKLKKGNTGMVCLTAPNTGVGNCRAGFYSKSRGMYYSCNSTSHEKSITFTTYEHVDTGRMTLGTPFPISSFGSLSLICNNPSETYLGTNKVTGYLSCSTGGYTRFFIDVIRFYNAAGELLFHMGTYYTALVDIGGKSPISFIMPSIGERRDSSWQFTAHDDMSVAYIDINYVARGVDGATNTLEFKAIVFGVAITF